MAWEATQQLVAQKEIIDCPNAGSSPLWYVIAIFCEFVKI